jgi:hypothetical protein
LFNPTTCPQEEVPTWFMEFVTANMNAATLPKLSVNSSAMAKRLLRIVHD